MEVYSLETIIALAFRIGTYSAKQVRNAVLERLYLRKEKTSIFFSLNTNGIAPEEKTFNGLERKSGRTDEKTPKKRMWGLRFSGEKIGVPVDMSVRLYADTLA